MHYKTKFLFAIIGTALILGGFEGFDAGISKINSQTGDSQTLATGTSGTDFAISSSANVHTFNLPDASGSARGLVTTGTQTIAGAKTFTGVIDIDNDLLDKSGDAGASGQILSSLGGSNAGLNWITATTYIGSMNGLTGGTQTFATGTTGTAFNISSSGTAHTFNLPVTSATTTTGVNNYAVLDAGHPAESKTNSTAAEQDYTTLYTIPANYLTENRVLRITVGLQTTTGTSTVTIVPYVEIGGTKVFTSGSSDLSNGATKGSTFTITIQGTAAASGSANVETFATGWGNTLGTGSGANNLTAQPVALATNGALTVVLGVQYSGTGSTETCVLRTKFTEQLN